MAIEAEKKRNDAPSEEVPKELRPLLEDVLAKGQVALEAEGLAKVEALIEVAAAWNQIEVACAKRWPERALYANIEMVRAVRSAGILRARLTDRNSHIARGFDPHWLGDKISGEE